MNHNLEKSGGDSSTQDHQQSSRSPLIRSMTTLSYRTAMSLPLDDNIDDDEEEAKRLESFQYQDCKGELLAIVLPREWQDFNMNNKDEAHQVNPSSFLVPDTIILDDDDVHSNSCTDLSSNGFQFDTVVDINNQFEPENTIVSLDLDMKIQEEDIHLHMNREATEEANRTFSRLELTATKRIFSIFHPGKSGTGKAGRKQKIKDGANKCKTVSKIYMKKENETASGTATTAATTSTITNINTDGFNAKELCETWQNSKRNQKDAAITLSLSIPKACLNDASKDDSSSQSLGDDNDDDLTVELAVTVNPPSILSVQTFEAFGSKLFTGVPVVIQTTLIHATRARVSWFVNEELALYDSHCFIPQQCHVGKILSVLITPFREGYHGKCFQEAYRFDNAIEDIPYMPLVSPLRDDFIGMKQLSMNRVGEVGGGGVIIRRGESLVRIMTYNILADLYVSREVDDETIMFPHVKYEYLRKTRRMPMIVAEILAHKADIICLQEVDGQIYDTYFEPVMNAMGYGAFYSNKVSCQREGCAMFWSREVFEKDEVFTFSLRDLFDTNDDVGDQAHPASQVSGTGASKPDYRRWDSMKGINNLLKSHPELRRVTMEKIGQILQVAKLKVRNRQGEQPEKVVVGNTHLFYHPMADHIRAMQTYVVCKKLDEVRRDDIDTPPYPLILCGDLNSDPLSGASQLLFTRSVEPDHHDCWKHLNEYQWEMGNNEYMLEHEYIGNNAGSSDFKYEEEQFQNAVEVIKAPDPSAPTLVLPDAFPQLVSGCKEMPEFTNYAVDFVDTLDYILASEVSDREQYGFVPVRSARMPTSDDVKHFIAMPNEFMPSDHVSVVADFKWIQEKQDG